MSKEFKQKLNKNKESKACSLYGSLVSDLMKTFDKLAEIFDECIRKAFSENE